MTGGKAARAAAQRGENHKKNKLINDAFGGVKARLQAMYGSQEYRENAWKEAGHVARVIKPRSE